MRSCTLVLAALFALPQSALGDSARYRYNKWRNYVYRENRPTGPLSGVNGVNKPLNFQPKGLLHIPDYEADERRRQQQRDARNARRRQRANEANKKVVRRCQSWLELTYRQVQRGRERTMVAAEQGQCERALRHFVKDKARPLWSRCYRWSQTKSPPSAFFTECVDIPPSQRPSAGRSAVSKPTGLFAELIDKCGRNGGSFHCLKLAVRLDERGDRQGVQAATAMACSDATRAKKMSRYAYCYMAARAGSRVAGGANGPEPRSELERRSLESLEKSCNEGQGKACGSLAVGLIERGEHAAARKAARKGCELQGKAINACRTAAKLGVAGFSPAQRMRAAGTAPNDDSGLCKLGSGYSCWRYSERAHLRGQLAEAQLLAFQACRDNVAVAKWELPSCGWLRYWTGKYKGEALMSPCTGGRDCAAKLAAIDNKRRRPTAGQRQQILDYTLQGCGTAALPAERAVRDRLCQRFLSHFPKLAAKAAKGSLASAPSPAPAKAKRPAPAKAVPPPAPTKAPGASAAALDKQFKSCIRMNDTYGCYALAGKYMSAPHQNLQRAKQAATVSCNRSRIPYDKKRYCERLRQIKERLANGER